MHLFYQWDKVKQALDYLMTGKGDLHARLSKAWEHMGTFQVNELPAELQPVYKRLAAEMERLISIDGGNLTDADRAKEAKVAMWVLRFYRYLTEFRAEKAPGSKMGAEDILDGSTGPGFVEVGPDGISTGQALSNEEDKETAPEQVTDWSPEQKAQIQQNTAAVTPPALRGRGPTFPWNDKADREMHGLLDAARSKVRAIWPQLHITFAGLSITVKGVKTITSDFKGNTLDEAVAFITALCNEASSKQEGDAK